MEFSLFAGSEKGRPFYDLWKNIEQVTRASSLTCVDRVKTVIQLPKPGRNSELTNLRPLKILLQRCIKIDTTLTAQISDLMTTIFQPIVLVTSLPDGVNVDKLHASTNDNWKTGILTVLGATSSGLACLTAFTAFSSVQSTSGVWKI